MRFAKPKRPADLINITPLIDVVFILLVFFMLAGAIERPPPVQAAPPVSASEESTTIEDLEIIISEDGVVAFDSVIMPTDEDLERTARIWFATRPNTAIQLKADAQADAARVIEVMEVLRAAGARSLALLTVGAQP